jgi:hypothetical protein
MDTDLAAGADHDLGSGVGVDRAHGEAADAVRVLRAHPRLAVPGTLPLQDVPIRRRPVTAAERGRDDLERPVTVEVGGRDPRLAYSRPEAGGPEFQPHVERPGGRERVRRGGLAHGRGRFDDGAVGAGRGAHLVGRPVAPSFAALAQHRPAPHVDRRGGRSGE